MKQVIGLVGIFMVCGLGLLGIAGCGSSGKTSCDPASGCVCTSGQTQKCSKNVGECKEGTQACINGKWAECTGITETTEICNSKDDDCDGQTDEAVADCCENGKSQNCGQNVGECKPGTQTCSNGTWGNCSGTLPKTEICSNKDDDCDGQTDEDLQNCGCTGGKAPAAETCDGIDNDCNGKIDDGIIGSDSYEPNNSCGNGAKVVDNIDQGVGEVVFLGVLDPSGDEDWYKTCAKEGGGNICIPFVDPQCMTLTLFFTPAPGTDHTKYEVCVMDNNSSVSDCGQADAFNCTLFTNKNCFTEAEWDATNGYFGMALQWDGLCGQGDSADIFVSVKAKQGQNFSSGCQQYELALKLEETNTACQ